jgi:hypothetical protein
MGSESATLWCENATLLMSELWQFVKVPQKEYEKLQPDELADLLSSIFIHRYFEMDLCHEHFFR